MQGRGDGQCVHPVFVIVLPAGGHLLNLRLYSVICPCGCPISRAAAHSLRAREAFGSGGGCVFPLNFPTWLAHTMCICNTAVSVN